MRADVTPSKTTADVITVPDAAALLAGAVPVLSAILIETVVAFVLLTMFPLIVKMTRPVDVGVIEQAFAPEPAVSAPTPIMTKVPPDELRAVWLA